MAAFSCRWGSVLWSLKEDVGQFWLKVSTRASQGAGVTRYLHPCAISLPQHQPPAHVISQERSTDVASQALPRTRAVPKRSVRAVLGTSSIRDMSRQPVSSPPFRTAPPWTCLCRRRACSEGGWTMWEGVIPGHVQAWIPGVNGAIEGIHTVVRAHEPVWNEDDLIATYESALIDSHTDPHPARCDCGCFCQGESKVI